MTPASSINQITLLNSASSFVVRYKGIMCVAEPTAPWYRWGAGRGIQRSARGVGVLFVFPLGFGPILGIVYAQHVLI